MNLEIVKTKSFITLDKEKKSVNQVSFVCVLTPLHSEWPKFHKVLAVLKAVGLKML